MITELLLVYKNNYQIKRAVHMFKFGPFILCENNQTLKKSNVFVDLEPQVFNVLLFLVKNRERLVSKDELFQNVWNGRVVTEQAITRIIYELRKILDDSSNSNSYIKTRRGKGYQLTVPVKIIEDGSTAKNKIWLVTSFVLCVFSLLLITKNLIVDSKYKKHSITANQTASSDFEEAAEAEEYSSIAVLPIVIKKDNLKVSILVQSVIEYLTNQIAIELDMKIIYPESLLSAQDYVDDITKVHNQTNARYIVRGEISRLSDQHIQILFELYQFDEDNSYSLYSLGSYEFPFPKDKILLKELYKKRKETIQDLIGIMKPGMKFHKLNNNQTNNSLAYQLAIEAHHIGRFDACPRFNYAENLLLRAISLDPSFAYAYNQLFLNYYKRVWNCGQSKIWHEKALKVAEKVEQLAPGEYHSLAIIRHAILVESNQVEVAYAIEISDTKKNPEALYREIYALRYAGFLSLAKSKIEELIQIDPYFFSQIPVQQSPNTLLYLGLYNEYIQLLSSRGNVYHDYYRGIAHWLKEEKTESIDIFASVVQNSSEGVFPSFAQVLILIQKGEKKEAKLKVRKIAKELEDNLHTDGEVTYKVAQLFALSGDKKSALKYLRKAVEQGFFPVTYFNKDPMLHSIQNTNEYRDIINTASVRHMAFAERFNLKIEI
ncbi:winged helix-turn-helix domain-containing protein [Marinicella sp. W31]|uniref:winged helix-turn-helix domain-containing protein n=1 Tax=Marinicella sp. W31 TaxID=3023713 RepID=UPI003757D2D8